MLKHICEVQEYANSFFSQIEYKELITLQKLLMKEFNKLSVRFDKFIDLEIYENWVKNEIRFDMKITSKFIRLEPKTFNLIHIIIPNYLNSIDKTVALKSFIRRINSYFLSYLDDIIYCIECSNKAINDEKFKNNYELLKNYPSEENDN